MEKEYKKYTDYLIKEIRMYPKIKYDTIYFGGGTPSLLPVAMISEILDELDWNYAGVESDGCDFWKTEKT